MGAWELFMIGLGWLLWNNNERERRAEEPILDEFIWAMIEEYDATGPVHQAGWYLRRSRPG